MSARRRASLRPYISAMPLVGVLGCQAAAPIDTDGQIDTSPSSSGRLPTTSNADDSTSTPVGTSTSTGASTTDVADTSTSTGTSTTAVADTSTSTGTGTTDVDDTSSGGLPEDSTTGHSEDSETTGIEDCWQDLADTGGLPADTSTGESGDEQTTGVGDCELGDIADAPPSTLVDGMRAVPIDILSVTADATIDYVKTLGTIQATMKFRLGPEGGHPIFDLRHKNFTSVKLDGEIITEADIAHHDLGGGPGTEMRVLAVDLPACSEHLLEFVYPMNNSEGLGFLSGWNKQVYWNLGLRDLQPAHYLERWLPANLIYDRHPLTLTVEVLNPQVQQVVYANGAIEQLGLNKWKVVYPAHFTALSPFFELTIAEGGDGGYVHSSGIVQPQGGGPVNVELYTRPYVEKPHAELHAEIAIAFDEFTKLTGAYTHPSFLCIIFGLGGGGMEYEGAAEAGYQTLWHEIFHSWFGRGLKPRHSNDGWLDEAWTSYVTDSPDKPVAPLDCAAPPVVLCSDNPWKRSTPHESYTIGKQVFATIAAKTGDAALRLAMRGFYGLHAPGLFSTAELERHLSCDLQSPIVRNVFHRFVYGNAGPAPAPPPGYCP